MHELHQERDKEEQHVLGAGFHVFLILYMVHTSIAAAGHCSLDLLPPDPNETGRAECQC
jgi:hypothetical protein